LSTAEILVSKFGPLMTLTQLAGTLSRSAEGLRFGLSTDSDFSRKVNAARVRYGRRVYFHTVKIAAVLDCQ
jgi:hypothetical protein